MKCKVQKTQEACAIKRTLSCYFFLVVTCIRNTAYLLTYANTLKFLNTYMIKFLGEINITLRTNSNGNPQLYWKFGRMVEGWLIKVAPATFSLSKWETDVWMIYFSGGLGYGSVQFKFLDIDTFQYIEFGQHFTTDFKRGFKLEDLSPIPWAPGTCA